ncbi:hypothetical protein BDN70DRAFT_97512 [Pholiota conissans]|uniref:Uncharacterized protein n=1 Tax=Pholiota conissans TaxID=109636 RepID=A0A9P5Z197_9AGAR|nr:hypothetical protein BDN70DRAFT_97512 [Pholiota conissans]
MDTSAWRAESSVRPAPVVFSPSFACIVGMQWVLVVNPMILVAKKVEIGGTTSNGEGWWRRRLLDFGVNEVDLLIVSRRRGSDSSHLIQIYFTIPHSTAPSYRPFQHCERLI